MRQDAAYIDPAELTGLRDFGDAPFLLVNLDRAHLPEGQILRPPCPLIGVGTWDGPLAALCDVVVETPVTLESLARSIESHPGAAAVVVQLLRGIEGQEIATALVQESLAYGLLQGGGEHGAWLAAGGRADSEAEGAVRTAREGDRLHILIDRPWAHNAIDRPMRDSLREAFDLAALDPDIAAVTLRGVGRAFCVGADLSEFGTTRDPVVAHAIRMRTLPAHALARCGQKLTVHVQGACVGAGLEMAAFAARIVAHPDAWFQLPELAMGLIPGAGGCVSVARRIGRQRAALMILSGRRISARTALSWGLVDNLSADEGEADVGG